MILKSRIILTIYYSNYILMLIWYIVNHIVVVGDSKNSRYIPWPASIFQMVLA
jgi:hypothetical protein